MKTVFLIFLLLFNYQLADGEDENIRYILIEAQCKPGFNALPGIVNKVILTKVWKEELENAFEMVNAEPELIKAFEVALENRILINVITSKIF